MNKLTEQICEQVNSDYRFYLSLNNNKWLPSVTTILDYAFPVSKHLKEYWLQHTKEEADTILQIAGNDGTVVHEKTEKIDRGDSVNVEVLTSKQRRCLQAYCNFLEDYNPKVLASEFIVRDEDEQYAGTVDRLYEIDGLPVIVDIKTSNTIQEKHFAQVGAYAYAWSNVLTLSGQVKGAILHLNNPRNKRGYTFKYIETLNYWKLFKSVKSTFELLHPNLEPKFKVYPKYFINPNTKSI